MMVRHCAVAAMALLLAGPTLAPAARADAAKTAAAKTHAAAASRTVTLDLTGLD